MKTKTITVSNQKGGVGKTTIAFHLGRFLFDKGKKVLLIDTDSQAALTLHSQISPISLKYHLYHLLRNSVPPEQVIIKRRFFDLIPASIELSIAEIELISEISREKILKEIIEKILKKNEYDFVIIDSPPHSGLLTLNSLVASDGVIIPVDTRFLGLRGLKISLELIEKVKMRANPNLEVIGIVPTFVERTSHSEQVLGTIKKEFGEKFRVFPGIKKTVKFQEVSVAGLSVLDYVPFKQPKDIIEVFEKITKEVLKWAEK